MQYQLTILSYRQGSPISACAIWLDTPTWLQLLQFSGHETLALILEIPAFGCLGSKYDPQSVLTKGPCLFTRGEMFESCPLGAIERDPPSDRLIVWILVEANLEWLPLSLRSTCLLASECLERYAPSKALGRLCSLLWRVSSMASLFLSRCERNTEINEFLVASSVSLPPLEQLMPLATWVDCLLVPVPRGGSVCSPILLLTLFICLG